MNLSDQKTLNDYLLSLVIHLCILICFTLITFKIPPRINELIIEIVTEPMEEIPEDNFAPAGSETIPNQRTNVVSNDIIDEPVEQLPYVDKQAPVTTSSKSIEPPVRKPLSKSSTAPVSGISSTYLSGIKSSLQTGQSGSSGYQLDDNDGSIAVLKSVLPNPAISDYGKVTLQFKIKTDGSVNAESITPVIISTDPNYTNASINALKQWLFTVRKYNSTKLYRISFIFNPE